MKERITRCFNKGSETYDTAAIVQTKVANDLIRRLTLVSAQNILEIGCGTGIFSRRIVTAFPQANVLLTDIASSMVEFCKKRFAGNSCIDYICADGEHFSSNMKFDLIVSSMTLHWFLNIKNSFQRIMEYLTPGGQFVFAMLGKNSLIQWREICKHYQLSIPTPSFPDFEVLQKAFPSMQLEIETVQHCYPSAYDFLKSLKNIGATAAHRDHSPMTAGSLRQVLRECNSEIKINYEVIYGKFIKK